jgi:hypothetical protein
MKYQYIQAPWMVRNAGKERIYFFGDAPTKSGKPWRSFVIACVQDFDFEPNGLIPHGLMKATAAVIALSPEMVDLTKKVSEANPRDWPELVHQAKAILQHIDDAEDALIQHYPDVLREEEEERARGERE